MPKIDAVSSKNCATSVQFPAATSCSSDMMSDVTARPTATINDATATAYSVFLLGFMGQKRQPAVFDTTGC